MKSAKQVLLQLKFVFGDFFYFGFFFECPPKIFQVSRKEV